MPTQQYDTTLITGAAGDTTRRGAVEEFDWVCPSGVTSVQVECWGGGGGGGDHSLTQDGGAGGGGGAYARSTVAVTPGTTYRIGVGKRGSYDSVGSFLYWGGNSWFRDPSLTYLVEAEGGSTPSKNNTGAAAAIGGVPGLAANSTGTVTFSGGTGGYGRDSNTGRGGPGGSSAGTAANGTSGPNPWSTATAAAGPTGSGIGGDGGNANGQAGFDGSAPGGGGGGAAESLTAGTVVEGGIGGGGRVLLTWTAPVGSRAPHNLTNRMNRPRRGRPAPRFF